MPFWPDLTPFSDLIGRVTIPVKELMAQPNKMFDRHDKLAGFEDASSMKGTLQYVFLATLEPCVNAVASSWSIGYFNKVPLNKELERPLENPPPEKKTAPGGFSDISYYVYSQELQKWK